MVIPGLTRDLRLMDDGWLLRDPGVRRDDVGVRMTLRAGMTWGVVRMTEGRMAHSRRGPGVRICTNLGRIPIVVFGPNRAGIPLRGLNSFGV